MEQYMSYVEFRSESASAELRGSERAWLGQLVTDLTLAVLNPGGPYGRDTLAPLIKSGHWLSKYREEASDVGWAQAFTTSWHVGGTFLTGDRDPFTISLNTADLIGSEQIKVAAWIHGQCEVHGYVEEPERGRLADVIDAGLAGGVYRQGQGWEGVAVLLRNGDGGPVVMSYSVTDGFPSPEALTGSDAAALNLDEEGEVFWALPVARRWELGVAWVRSAESGLGAWVPGERRRYGSPALTAFDLIAASVTKPDSAML
jgi:hypothetical protein